MTSILSLIIIVFLSILITRVATIALTHTGLNYTAANFQARSAFTGVGFTTQEAETITEHPVRRKIIMILMLLGNVGAISAISSLIVTFVGDSDEGLSGFVSLMIIVGSMGFLWLLSSSKYINKALEKLIDRALRYYTDLKVRDYNRILNLSGDYEITELKVEQDDWMAERTLSELALKDEGIYVLGIHRSDGSYLGIPNGNSEIESGDLLVLYGKENKLRELDERKRGAQGNQEHEESKREHENEKSKEQSSDEARRSKRAGKTT
ncbi:MAG: potassium channel family protein [Cyclobacteriaceae bacterium]